MFAETKDCNAKNLYEYYATKKNEREDNIHKQYITKFKRIKKAYSILEKNDVLSFKFSSQYVILTITSSEETLWKDKINFYVEQKIFDNEEV